MATSGAVKCSLAVGRFDQRPAGQDEDERGQEGEPGHHRGCQRRAQEQAVRPQHLFRPATEKADESHHHDQRARRGLAQRQAVDHLWPGEPVEVLHRALVHIGQHRVRAAKGQQRRLGEEPAHLRQRVPCRDVPVLPGQQSGHGQQPQQRTGGQHLCQALLVEAGMGRCGRVVADQSGMAAGQARAMAAPPDANCAGATRANPSSR
jgi:hypothetical protein